jgi:hypothetical protein
VLRTLRVVYPMKGWTRAGLGILMFTGAGLLSRHAIAQLLFSFESPHHARAAMAAVDPALGQRWDMQASEARINTGEDLVAFALRTTADALHFGLGHRTRIAFEGAEREGNCVEYAELFATVLNREHGNVDAHAWIVRSDARVLGKTMPDPAWKDHDWVLVAVRTGEGIRRLYVDPTLYDMGLGWDISRVVHGEVRLPALLP